jgi:hypothetical protein
MTIKTLCTTSDKPSQYQASLFKRWFKRQMQDVEALCSSTEFELGCDVYGGVHLNSTYSFRDSKFHIAILTFHMV